MNRTLALAFMSCNRVDGVERSLGSVLAQTLDDIEVVVSDDASSDGTFERLCEIVGRYDGPKRIRLRRNERRLGVVGHFNAIMAETSVDYVMFAHDDDWQCGLQTNCDRLPSRAIRSVSSEPSTLSGFQVTKLLNNANSMAYKPITKRLAT